MGTGTTRAHTPSSAGKPGAWSLGWPMPTASTRPCMTVLARKLLPEQVLLARRMSAACAAAPCLT
eukprot:8975262-Lingulodinium_polyedra.AAC.1